MFHFLLKFLLETSFLPQIFIKALSHNHVYLRVDSPLHMYYLYEHQGEARSFYNKCLNYQISARSTKRVSSFYVPTDGQTELT
jgi:hypothetical protein